MPIQERRQPADGFRHNAAALSAWSTTSAQGGGDPGGGGAEERRRHLARNKLLPRERNPHPARPGSPFLELSQMAATRSADKVPAAG
jgi:3-methylcrotonyl-CoA carboxylase beta subunit